MATRKDVAELAGVSQTLVSYYINNSGYVGKENRKKIQAAINTLNYKPNLLAKSLKQQKTNQLVLICNEIRNPFYSGLVYKSTQLAYEKGYIMLFTHVVDDKDFIHKLCSYQVSGIMVATGKVNTEHLNEIAKRGVPMVLMADKINQQLDERILHIGVDAYTAMRQVVKHVIDKGHTQIAWISSLTANKYEQMDGKTKGLCDELTANNIMVNTNYFVGDTADAMTAYKKVRSIISRADAPTAYICGNDAVATGVLKLAHELGKKVPDDIVVTGFDNTENAKLSIPALTTVDVCVDELAQKSIEGLLKKIDGESVNDIKIQGKLVIRESC